MRRFGLPMAMVVVAALHLGLVLHFVSPSLVLGPEPIVGLDYDTHYEQTLRAVEAYRTSGRVWSYDPHLLAGQPSGAIFDADNKLIEVFAIALDSVGVPTHRAFNLLILLAHLLVPLVTYASARLFSLERPAAVGAAWLASMLWFFDALAHWCFYVGMIAWGSAAYAVLLPLALMYRFSQTRRLRVLAALFPVMVVVHHLHPYAFVVLVVPMTLLYVRARRALRWQHHAALWGVAVGVLLLNSWWLVPAIQLWHYILDSGFYMDATPAYLLYDYFGLLKEPDIHGVIAMRTGFRFLTFGAAALGLWGWRRARDERFAPLAAGLGVLLFIAYFGRWVTPLRQLQPYRFVLPAMYLAIIPAVGWLLTTTRTLMTRRPAAPALGLLALLAFVGLPRLARDVLYFMPTWVPRHTRPLPAPPPDINGGTGFGNIWWPVPFDFRNRPMNAADRFAIEAVRDNDDGSGRWLVQWWVHGERLAWATDAQVLGGFREINLAHSDANLFRTFPEGMSPQSGQLERYLERYNVQWLVVAIPTPWLEVRRDLLELVAHGFGQRVYRTRIEPSWFMDGGPGRVTAKVDRLSIEGSAGGSLVLKYHFLETLVCRPGCELYRAEVEGDRVGFIGIRNAPSDFEIINP